MQIPKVFHWVDPFFGLYLWIMCVIVAVIISLLTKPIPKECLYR